MNVNQIQTELANKFDSLLALSGLQIDDVRCASVDDHGRPVSIQDFTKELRRLTFRPEVVEALEVLKQHGLEIPNIHPCRDACRLGLVEALHLAKAFLMLDAVNQFKVY